MKKWAFSDIKPVCIEQKMGICNEKNNDWIFFNLKLYPAIKNIQLRFKQMLN